MADGSFPVGSLRACCGEPFAEGKVTRSQSDCALPGGTRFFGLPGFLQEFAKSRQKALAFMQGCRAFDDIRSRPDLAFLLKHSREHLRRRHVSRTRDFAKNAFRLGLLPVSLEDPRV